LLIKRLFNKKLQLIIEFIKKKGKQTVSKFPERRRIFSRMGVTQLKN